MKIIIDTNIIFSGLLNSRNIFGEIIFNSDSIFDLYSCSYMRHEIEKHWNKLKLYSKLTDKELEESRFRIFEKISFINEELIPRKHGLSQRKSQKILMLMILILLH